MSFHVPKKNTAQYASIISRELKKLYPRPKIALNYGSPWELLVAVILSAQCTDKKVNEVTKQLFQKYKSLKDYTNATPSEFQNYIWQTGFYRNKAKHILASAEIVKKKYNGRVPRTMEQLLTLPGIARKSANIVLSEAFGIIEGVPVDTHVIRLAKLYDLTKYTVPKKIEEDLMKLLPKDEWYKFSLRLISYGREYCPAKRHDHAACPFVKALKRNKK